MAAFWLSRKSVTFGHEYCSSCQIYCENNLLIQDVTLLVMQYTTVVCIKSAVTETITSIKSVTVLENPNYNNGYHSKIKAAKTAFFSDGFRSASRNFFGGFTAIVVKIRFSG